MKLENFKEIVLDSFDFLINEKKLNPEIRDDNEIRLLGITTHLRFTYDRGDLRCSFLDPILKRMFGVNLVYEFLYPRDRAFTFSINEPFTAQLDKFAIVIKERLMNVMDGDFSWAEDFENRFGKSVYQD